MTLPTPSPFCRNSSRNSRRPTSSASPPTARSSRRPRPPSCPRAHYRRASAGMRQKTMPRAVRFASPRLGHGQPHRMLFLGSVAQSESQVEGFSLHAALQVVLKVAADMGMKVSTL
eukprot:4775569-Pleurochrysis_carterae.AAC.1